MATIVDMPADRGTMVRLAGWVMDEWSHMFPNDTLDWYLDVWTEASVRAESPPHAVVAVEDGGIVGTASVVVDDELPGATEPGPWLALTYVLPAFRGRGVGTALVRELMRRCPGGLWLYTESEADWYGSMGWEAVRESQVNGVPVTVMHWQGAA